MTSAEKKVKLFSSSKWQIIEGCCQRRGYIAFGMGKNQRNAKNKPGLWQKLKKAFFRSEDDGRNDEL